jgi:hypothetical protein
LIVDIMVDVSTLRTAGEAQGWLPPRYPLKVRRARMSQQKDDLEAVRKVADALDGFDPKDQERIIRWAREKIGLSVAPVSIQVPPSPSALASGSAPSAGTQTSPATSAKDLKTFVIEKNPKNDVQFAATVAYYYRFGAPENLRKSEINGDDLQEACRLVGRERFKHPSQTVRNAHTLGLLDKRDQPGFFAINSVGENLVAVALPGDGPGAPRIKTKKGKKRGRQKELAKSPARK